MVFILKDVNEIQISGGKVYKENPDNGFGMTIVIVILTFLVGKRTRKNNVINNLSDEFILSRIMNLRIKFLLLLVILQN